MWPRQQRRQSRQRSRQRQAARQRFWLAPSPLLHLAACQRHSRWRSFHHIASGTSTLSCCKGELTLGHWWERPHDACNCFSSCVKCCQHDSSPSSTKNACRPSSRAAATSDLPCPCRWCSCEPQAAPLDVAVLLSGGVDSSLALHLLKAAGHNVTAFYLQVGMLLPPASPAVLASAGCCSHLQPVALVLSWCMDVFIWGNVARLCRLPCAGLTARAQCTRARPSRDLLAPATMHSHSSHLKSALRSNH